MAFSVPSLLDVWTRLRNSMRTFLPGTDAWIEPNNLSVAGKSFTLTIGSVYERVLYLYRQLFASTADGFHLEFRHAFEYGIARKPSAPAEGFIAFSVTPSIFAISVAAGTRVTRPDGVTFVLVNTVVPDDSLHCVALVRATTPGAATNTLPGTPMAFDAGAGPGGGGVPFNASVGPDGLGGGADIESDDALRARVLLRKRQPPHGGAKSDYEEWALAVPGVTRVFVSPFTKKDPGEAATPLTLFPLFDDTRANGIPTSADLLVVANAIDPLRPVTSRLYVAAARAVPVAIGIGGLQGDTNAMRASIAANLAALFQDRVPVVTADNKFTLPVAWIDEAIGRADGYVRHTLRAPAGDVVFSAGDLPILGQISYGI